MFSARTLASDASAYTRSGTGRQQRRHMWQWTNSNAQWVADSAAIRSRLVPHL